MSKFSDKVAVVTGAGRGIGNAIAKKLASEGAKIAAISRSVENSQSCAEEINSECITCIVSTNNFTDTNQLFKTQEILIKDKESLSLIHI